MKLFEPLMIRDVELKNRVVLAPMISNLGTPSGYPSDAHILYLARRSSVGLIITEYTYVNKVDARGSYNQLGLYDDELIPKFSRLTEVIHNLDSKIFVQLVHVGRKTRRSIIWGNEPIAPSNLPLLDNVREMNEDDINRVIMDFVKAAERAEKSGFDGIELHGAHGYLIAQFLSPAPNKRSDKYKDGVLFLEELIKVVRRVVSIPIGLRISVTEFDPNGLNPTLVARIIKRIENLLDYVHLSAGRDGPLGSSAPFYYKRPAYVEEARVVRESVPNLTLFLVGSVVTLEDAEKVLEVADAVVLGRQLLADPDWVIKVKNNLPIRPCIRCNQLCRLITLREVRCDVNPELGWEILRPAKGEGRVKVIGGGLMGLEAARILATRGFEIELYEKGERLGGQLNEIRDPYKKKEFSLLINYYEKELRRLGVKVYLNREEKGGDIIAVPRQRQPEFKEYKGLRILVNSNLYAYQDYVFEWAKYNEVYVTENIFKGLDRSRGYLLEEKYRELGVRIVKEPVKADVVINDVRRTQPNIAQAVARGYWLGLQYFNSPRS